MNRPNAVPTPGVSPRVRWIHRRRPVLTAVLVVAALANVLVRRIPPVDLLAPRASLEFGLPWALMLVGVAVRMWGSGNLRKNQEITRTGIYRMIRHPLYLGSLCFFFAYFLALGDPVVGTLLFTLLVGGVYYPTMLSEEAHLAEKFPDQAEQYHHLGRLFPRLSALPEALDTDRFTLRAAWGNLGLRTLWFLVLLPLFLAAVAWIQERTH